jgi:acyl-coenzyme A synthetase/AMP-(fatty) acid ligase
VEAALPLWAPAQLHRPIAWRDGQPVALGEFVRHVAALTARLPAGSAMLDLCEDRYHFLVAYAAALSAGRTVLLPHTRAEQVVADVEKLHPGSFRCTDDTVSFALREARGHVDARAVNARVAAEHVAMIGFTSGSTGQSKAFPKLWRSMAGSNACNGAAMREALRSTAVDVPWIVATVPPQHMYGMELSVLLPLIGGMAVHSGRPLFPADIAQALAEVPEPRVLVSTPVHLRAIVESSQEFPHTSLIVSATAPLDAALAAAAENKLGGRMLEMFGSTETCVFASRCTAVDEWWKLYAGVTLQPTAAGTMVNAPWFVSPMLLQDILEVRGGEFIVRGRNTDLIEVAGKRASLSDLTRRLQSIEGVKDAVVFQPEPETVGTIRRVAALVVAPGLSAKQILERLAPSVDSAFIPRPLLVVDALPRNELGKLPLGTLMRVMKGQST